MSFLKSIKVNEVFFCGLILSSLTVASCGANRGNPRNDPLISSDIVNGKGVTMKNENAHSIVALVADKDEGQALCTGTLISQKVILTAAHCVDGKPERLRIVFGVDVKKTKGQNILEADKVIQNPNWNRHLSSGEGDLALVHFKGDLPEGYKPTKLADENLILSAGQKIFLIGYGVTNAEEESGAGKLRQTTSKILSRYSPTELVSDGEKRSVCFGDSGGPAFIKIDKEYIQWGVASSVTNKTCNEASIHTEVMKYKSWIHASITRLNR